jgi:hypothetical protein
MEAVTDEKQNAQKALPALAGLGTGRKVYESHWSLRSEEGRPVMSVQSLKVPGLFEADARQGTGKCKERPGSKLLRPCAGLSKLHSYQTLSQSQDGEVIECRSHLSSPGQIPDLLP